MNWDALGTIAEIVSAVAILLTLIYLAVQIRQAKVATLGQIVQSRTSEFNVLTGTLDRLPNVDALFRRFPALDGSFYFVGGVSANYHQADDIILAPIRLGAGFRAGVNIGYMKYTRSKTWNPF